MVQFFHLSLLLAIVLLPLVSVAQVQLRGGSVTFEFPDKCKVIRCCRGSECENDGCNGAAVVKVIQGVLTIRWLKRSGSYRFLCCEDSYTDQCAYLTVKIDSEREDYMVNFSYQVKSTEADCRRLSCEELSSQSSVFSCENCFPMSLSHKVLINLPTVSDLLRKNCSEIDGLHFYRGAKSWIDALEHCHKNSSSLVQITSNMVQQAVNSLLKNETNSMQKGAWIGLERSIFGKNVAWMWTSGPKVEDNQQWNSFPVDDFNNHCGKIIWVKESEEFKWLDADCHEELPFICQG